MTERALVLGATGGIGSALTKVMLQRGWQVVAMVRDPQRASKAWTDPLAPHWRAGDAMVRDDVIAAAAGSTVIVHGVNPPGYRRWDRLVLPMIDNTIAAARAAAGARILLPGTIYNYDPVATPVIDETTPQRPKGKKGEIRVALERRLADAAPEVPSLIVRACDFFGPSVRQSWFTQAMARPNLKNILNPGWPGVGHSWAYVPDLAEAMVRLLELESGRLRVAECLQFAGFWDANGEEMAAAIRRAAENPALKQWRFPWWLMRLLAPFGGFPAEVVEVLPFWRFPLRLDNSRLIALLGEEPHTSLDEAVLATLASY